MTALFSCPYCEHVGSDGWMHLRTKHGDLEHLWNVNRFEKKDTNQVNVNQNDNLSNRFRYHKPGSDTVANAHSSIRLTLENAAKLVVTICPAGREQALALTKLEEAMMWANAAITRNHPDNKQNSPGVSA